jgi:hypothetical protein
VIAIGDSHTYGVGVERQEAWPAVLATRINQTVYSMAHGGYGPGQYERMLPEALTHQPRLIVVALYMGNDFYDAYAFARGTPAPPRLADLAVRAAAMEKASSIDEQAAELWMLGRRSSLRGWLGDHIQLYRLAHRVRQQIGGRPALHSANFEAVLGALTSDQRRYVSVVTDQNGAPSCARRIGIWH